MLKNIEFFWHDGKRYGDDDCWADKDGEPLPEGWYYWFCFPGCLPDSEPFGPFKTHEAAEADARETFDIDENEELDQ